MDPAQTTSAPERGGEGFLTHAAEARLRAERDRLASENRKMIDALAELRGYVDNEFALWLINGAIPAPGTRS